MRRTYSLFLGVLEIAVAGILVALAFQLPGAGEVREGFGRAERISGRAGTQVRLFRAQVHDLRRPELKQLSQGLQVQTRAITARLRNQSVDYDAVQTMRDALDDLGGGMDELAGTLDADRIGQVGKGLGETATFLDDVVTPASEQAARDLDELTRTLRRDAERMGNGARALPLDLKTARDVHDSLARLGAEIDRLREALPPARLDEMRDSFARLEEVLNAGANQVDGREDGPLTFDTLAAGMEARAATREQADPGASLRRTAQAARLARTNLDRMAEGLPALRASLAESREVIDATRAALAAALAHEPLMKRLPERLARLAEELPTVSANLSRLLHDTQTLKDLAGGLRRAERGFDGAAARWPRLRVVLVRSADFLRAARGQLDRTLRHRDEYEAALKQTISLAETFASMLPLMIDHLYEQLGEQEQALEDLGRSIDDFSTALPEYARSTADALQMVRALLALAAAAAALHGASLVGSVVTGRGVAR